MHWQESVDLAPSNTWHIRLCGCIYTPEEHDTDECLYLQERAIYLAATAKTETDNA